MKFTQWLSVYFGQKRRSNVIMLSAQNLRVFFCQEERVAKIPTTFVPAGKTSAVIHDKLNCYFIKIIIHVLLNDFFFFFFKRNCGE